MCCTSVISPTVLTMPGKPTRWTSLFRTYQASRGLTLLNLRSFARTPASETTRIREDASNYFCEHSGNYFRNINSASYPHHCDETVKWAHVSRTRPQTTRPTSRYGIAQEQACRWKTRPFYEPNNWQKLYVGIFAKFYLQIKFYDSF